MHSHSPAWFSTTLLHTGKSLAQVSLTVTFRSLLHSTFHDNNYLFALSYFAMYYIYGIFRPSLLIELYHNRAAELCMLRRPSGQPTSPCLARVSHSQLT
jgi:hypothetical protein